jgi:hypothetical protein
VPAPLLARLDAAFARNPDPDAIQKSINRKGWVRVHTLTQEEYDTYLGNDVHICYDRDGRDWTYCASSSGNGLYKAPSWQHMLAPRSFSDNHWMILASEFDGKLPCQV